MNNLTLNQKLAIALLGGLVLGGALGWLILSPGDSRIILNDVPVKASVYIDNDLSKQNAGKSVMIGELSTGKHTVLVAAEGFWPWAKTIELSWGDRLTFGVLALPVEPSIVKDPSLSKLNTAKAGTLRSEMTKVPTKDAPIFSDNKDIALWVEDNNIVASWRNRRSSLPAYFCNPECKTRMIVFQSDVPIRSLSFYGKRPDVLLFAADNSIFALELDARGTQNFQPLYAGSAPIFTLSSDSQSALVYDTGPKQNGFFTIELN